VLQIQYVRPITSATKDCFINNLPDQFHNLSILDSLEELDIVTETFNSLFFSTLDTVAPLCLKKENSPTPWYNEHTPFREQTEKWSETGRKLN